MSQLTGNKDSNRSKWFALAIMIAVFMMDMFTRMGIVVGVLYLSCLPILISQRKSTIVAFTSFASTLILIKIYLFYAPALPLGVYINRLISILALWVTCMIIIWNKRLSEKIHVQREHFMLELQRRNEELQQFAYVASHDLQEPLRTMNSFVDLFSMEYGATLDNNAKAYLQFMTRASERMRMLVKGLLDFSLIGKNSQLVEVHCHTIVNEVVEDLQKLISDTGATILVDRLPVVEAYPVELKSLFQNLISNAIKFRCIDRSPVVRINSTESEHQWEFCITDNGIGIDKQHYEKIFLIFQKLHSRGEYEGSGIGLAHCKKIASLHCGKIWVSSRFCQGSEFHFTISKNCNKN